MNITLLKTVRYYSLYYDNKSYKLKEIIGEESGEEQRYLYNDKGQDVTDSKIGQEILKQFKLES